MVGGRWSFLSRGTADLTYSSHAQHKATLNIYQVSLLMEILTVQYNQYDFYPRVVALKNRASGPPMTQIRFMHPQAALVT